PRSKWLIEVNRGNDKRSKGSGATQAARRSKRSAAPDTASNSHRQKHIQNKEPNPARIILDPADCIRDFVLRRRLATAQDSVAIPFVAATSRIGRNPGLLPPDRSQTSRSLSHQPNQASRLPLQCSAHY